MYVKAPPSMAYILSGFRKEPRVLIGGGGVKIPVLERLDKVYLGQVTVDVKTSQPVPTHDFLDVMVDAVCKVRVKPDTEGTRLAAKNFLNMNSVQIAAQVKDSLEGNMREVVGSLDLIKINTDRDAFSDEIQKKAAPDMAKYIAEPMSKIGNMTVYGTNGSEASGISGNVPAIIKQTRDIVKDATGVDMADIMKANTINAKVNKNVNVNGDVENTNVNV
nr:MAG TPA: flotillin [Crassvirales sp.]